MSTSSASQGSVAVVTWEGSPPGDQAVILQHAVSDPGDGLKRVSEMTDVLLSIVGTPWLLADDDPPCCPWCGEWIAAGDHRPRCIWLAAARALGIA